MAYLLTSLSFVESAIIATVSFIVSNIIDIIEKEWNKPTSRIHSYNNAESRSLPQKVNVKSRVTKIENK